MWVPLSSTCNYLGLRTRHGELKHSQNQARKRYSVPCLKDMYLPSSLNGKNPREDHCQYLLRGCLGTNSYIAVMSCWRDRAQRETPEGAKQSIKAHHVRPEDGARAPPQSCEACNGRLWQ